MASTYSDRLKLELMEAGANSGVWGNNTNENLEVIDAAIGGYLSKSVAGSANVTLTTADRDPDVETTNESANKVIDLNGTLTGNIHVFVPALEKEYTIFNNTSGAYTVTVAATGHSANGVTVTQGTYSHLYCDGSANYNIKNSVSTLGATEFKANVSLGDSNYINLGASNDLKIFHDGSDSRIEDRGTGNLILGSNGTGVEIRRKTDSADEAMVIANNNGSVDLYYDNSKKFETTSSGVDVTGTITFDGGTTSADLNFGDNDKANFGASDDLQIYHNGTDNYVMGTTSNNLYLGANNNTGITIDRSGNAIFDFGVLANEGSLTDGATIAWDVNTAPVCKVTLGGNRTLSAPTNQAGSGQFISILVIQDSTGSRTLTWNAIFEFKDDTAPTLTTTGGKGDLFIFRYYGTGSKWIEVGRNQNLSLS